MNPPAQLNLLVIYRDFISMPAGGSARHPDFEIFAGEASRPGWSPDARRDGKPVMDGRCAQAGVTAACPYDQQLTTPANFDQWYRDVAGVNIADPGRAAVAPRRRTVRTSSTRQPTASTRSTARVGRRAPARERTAIADPDHQRRPRRTTSASPPRSATSSSIGAASR